MTAKRTVVFFDSHNDRLRFGGRFGGQNLRPGIIGKLVPPLEANLAASGKEDQIKDEGIRTLRWSDVHTMGELKKNVPQDTDTHNQIAGYVHMLPRVLPNLAGMLMLAIDLNGCHIEWSETSGMVRTHTMEMSSLDTWRYLISYLYTLYEPRDELPFWDYTLKKIEGGEDNLWKVKVGDEEYDAKLIYATHHHSRQTCVLDAINVLDKDKCRIIKDIWLDEGRRFKEHEMLEKLKGTPGVVQLDKSQTVPIIKRDPKTEEEIMTGEPLQTSKNHAHLLHGCLPERPAPRRIKRRHVFHTRGIPLKKRKSVRQIFAGVYDSVQGVLVVPYSLYKVLMLFSNVGHQQMLMDKKILHRDVSRGNILLNPKHHGCKVCFTKKKGVVPFVPIEAVLKDAAE